MRGSRCLVRLVLSLLPTVTLPAVAAGQELSAPVTHHAVEVRLEPEQNRLQAVDSVTFTTDGSDRPLRFLLHRGLEVTRIVHGESERDWEVRERWNPRDFWVRPDYAELGAFAVARQYDVPAPEGGWPREARLEVTYAGAVYDSLHAPEVAYSRGFETTSGLVDPRGAFLHGETFWVPWSTDQRFTFELTTELRDGWQSMSQGRRTAYEFDGDRSRTTWSAESPQELVYLVAGPYVVRSRSHGHVELYTLTYENTEPSVAEPYLESAARYLDRYGEEIGPYPFAKWAMVENWWQTGFGMPGFTLLGDRVIRLPFIVDTSYGHEILHCWWGNGVYVDYERGNWCEGLTAFGADYAYKREESAAAARDYRRDQLRAYLDFASGQERDFALRDFRERSDFGTQAVGYGKSLMVFHMLEKRLGEAVLRRGLRELFREYLFRPAAWEDLERVFSRVSGRDLEDWFAQWIDRPGAVELRLGRTERRDGGWAAEIVQGTPTYTVALPAVWVDEQGRRHQETVDLRRESTWWKLPAHAVSVELDPEYDIYRKLHRAEVAPTLGQTLGADSTLVVVGERANPELAGALRAVGKSWSENQDMRVVDEATAQGAAESGRSLYLLGEGAAADRAVEIATRIASEASELVRRHRDEGLGLVLTVRDPESEDRAWTVVLPSDAAQAAALGRKLPHYSRYSWLLFEGENNVEKGQWTLTSSPLRQRLGQRGER